MKMFLIITGLLLFVSCTKPPSVKNLDVPSIIKTETSISNLTSSVIFNEEREASQSDSQIIDFGSVKENNQIIHRVYLKNDYTQSVSLNIQSISNALNGTAFQFVQTNCLDSLLKKSICFFDIRLINDANLSYSPITLDISFNNENEYFGKITLIGERGTVVPVKSYQFTNVGQVLNFTNTDKMIRVYVKNYGDKLNNPQFNIPSEYTIAKTDCVNVLPKDKVCFIDLKINSNIDPNIIGVNKPIIFDGSSFSITAGASTPSNSILCSPNYSNISDSCIQTVQIRSCSSQPAHSNSGYEETINAGLNWTSCLDYSCNPTYSNVEGSCVLTNQSRACLNQPLNSNNGFESTINGGVNWGLCTGYSCNENYTNVDGSCLITNQSRLCNSQPANSYEGFEYSTNGGQSWGSCSGFTCNNGYTSEGELCKVSLLSYGSYKAWGNSSYAKSCNEYKNPPAGYKYAGSVGDGIYKVKPDNGTPFDSYCDMTTDSSGWTLMFSSALLSGSGYSNSALIDKVLNGTATGSELRASFSVLGSPISGQFLMNAITRSSFEYIRMGTSNWMRSSQISTFVAKNTSLTSWSEHNCSAQFRNPTTNQITSFYDNDSGTTQMSKTKFGWNISLTGSYCTMSAKLGCLVNISDPTTPVDGISGVDYTIMGLKGINNCSVSISNVYNNESYNTYYLVSSTAHRAVNSFTLDPMFTSKNSFIWVK